MKSRMKAWMRGLVVALCAGMMLTALGCDAGDQNPDESGSGTQEDGGPDDGELIAIANIASYKVIRQEILSDRALQTALELKNTLQDTCDIAGIDTDWSKDGSYDKTAYEILVGDVAREETEQARAWALANKGSAEHWYYIGVHGNKIALLGSNDMTLYAAVRHLTAHYISGTKKGDALMVPKQWCEVASE